MTVPRPQPGEFAPFYANYIAQAVARTDSVDELVVQRDRVTRALAALTDAQAGFRYAPDKWSVREVTGHIADAERIFGYRLLRAARADTTPLPGFDENAYARTAGSDARPLRDLVDEWASARTASVAMVRGFGADVWERRVSANGFDVSARALFYIILGHVDHHCKVLGERYAIVV
jgi:hypothetical protein